MNRIFDLVASTAQGRRRLAAARLRREVLVALEEALSDAGMTQATLAAALGRSRSAVNQVFGGDGNIRISTLAEYLHEMGQELVLTRVSTGTSRKALWRDAVDAVAQQVIASESSSRWIPATQGPQSFQSADRRSDLARVGDVRVA